MTLDVKLPLRVCKDCGLEANTEEDLDKQEWITELVSELMYQDEFLEYAEAMDIALKLWEQLKDS